MYQIGIDIGKLKHCACVCDSESGETLVEPFFFENNDTGYKLLISKISLYKRKKHLIGMEDTGHYNFDLLEYLLDQGYKVALINPKVTDLERRTLGKSSKNDKVDTQIICKVLLDKDKYRIASSRDIDTSNMRSYTRQHHDLKEQENVLKNRLQKDIDILFPEFNDLFYSKYSIIYNNIIKSYGASAKLIAKADIRNLRKCFEYVLQGRRSNLTPEELKDKAKSSIGLNNEAIVIEAKNLINQIELIESQINEIDKKIEEYSKQLNSPISSVKGIGTFGTVSILSEYGDILNFTTPDKMISFAGVAPYEYQSGNYKAPTTVITKKGSKYLRKTLYQVILPVIRFNPTFQEYYNLKRSQGKSHRCALGHCVRKLIRVIHHLVTTNTTFDPTLLK